MAQAPGWHPGMNTHARCFLCALSHSPQSREIIHRTGVRYTVFELSVVQTPYIPLWRFEAALCPGPVKAGVPAVPELAQTPEEAPAEGAAAEPERVPELEPEPEPGPDRAAKSKVSVMAAWPLIVSGVLLSRAQFQTADVAAVR